MQICVGCAYVSRSAVGRGILTALGWIVSPPFPMKTFDSLEPGLQWLKTQLPELDLAHSYQKYTSLRTRHLSSAHEPGRTR
jgi:hypothetical protein